MSGAKIIELDASNTCELCDNALAKYNCPKCHTKYCSLTCYQSDKHLQCSEEFYKDCIIEELSNDENQTSKEKMLEILKRTHLKANQEEEQADSELDSDDDDVIDITERLAGVDLDDSDKVWDKLTQDERQEFVAFLKSGDVTKLIPSWAPWWLQSEKKVAEVAQNDDKQLPAIIPIKNFREISKKEPAACVKYNLINVIAAYLFAVRYFNGEHRDFSKEVITCIASLSLCLKNNQNFEDFETAVKSVEFQCIESDWIMADAENFKLLREDIDSVLKGPHAQRNFHVLCALSDLHELLGAAAKSKTAKSAFSKSFPNNHFPEVRLESKNKIKSCTKKVEYLLSYAKDFTL